MNTRSITRTLQLSLSVLLFVSLFAAGYTSFSAASGQIERDYDSQLISDSFLVWTLVNEELQEENNLREVKDLLEMRVITGAQQREMLEFNQYRAFRVWRAGQLVLASSTAQPASVPAASEGFSTVTLNDAQWRVYTMVIPQRQISVEIWEHQRVRMRLLDRVLDSISASAAVILPLVWLVLLLVIRYGLSGLTRLAQQVESRAPDSLEFIPIQSQLPRELHPLTTAINGLIAKLRDNLSRERLLMDSVAHEIRTPLTTLKLKGQLLSAATTPEERRTATERLLTTLDDTVNLANRLLLLSKVSHQEVARVPTRVFPLAQSAMAELALIAAEKELELSLEGDEQAQMLSNAEWLQQLLSILIENAVKYTPSGGNVRVMVTPQTITIADTGPGIAPEARAHVFEKFYRAPGVSQKGHGLGLAIAREIAMRLGLDIVLSDTPGGGLTVRLSA